MKFQVIITIICVVISLMIGAYHFNLFNEKDPKMVVEYAPPSTPQMMERVAPLESAHRDGTVTDTMYIYEECDCESEVDTVYLPTYIETYILPEGFLDNIIKLVTIITPLLVPIVTYKLNKKDSSES